MGYVTLERVSRYYGSLTALNQVTFSIESGETVAIVGSNGAGKSTLLQCVAGMQLPDDGVVRIGDLDLSSSEQYRSCKRDHGIGYLPQDSLLYADLSIRENLEFLAGMHRISERKAEVNRILELCGLAAVADRRVRECSQGMVRRAGAARTFLGSPRLLLLDEPYAHLDQEGCDRLTELLQRHAADGGSAILATHLIERVQSLASRAIILESGRLVREYSLAGGVASGGTRPDGGAN